ncbi:hypothetical protein C7U60_11835 [Mesorhizobium plurifarium]|uniref:hypothetical protein n=1 Tax=Sinorhizobium arboris TaxID=76745 RepID=UPI00047F0928|nr:hypothetical protein [Sinorhizobium arboris]PST21950.1 hypothetical protein C7U60_11835 [Mesorhizobium plurifarium]
MNAPAPARDTTARLAAFGDADQAFVKLLMENPGQDEHLIEELRRHLDLAVEAPFLNTLRLEKLGRWFGGEAPARLQMRLMETARCSQHPAYQAFKGGLTKSGGLERAFPKN